MMTRLQPSTPRARRRLARAVIGVALIAVSSFSALALEPPRPGEIEEMRKAGTLQQSLDNAARLGNDRVDPNLVERLKYKIDGLRGKAILAPPPIWRGMPTIGNVRIFALLIEFQDYRHSVAAGTVNNMLFGAGDPVNYPLESLTSYYDRASYGLLNLDNGATLGWYRTAYNRSNVVETPTVRDNLIKEALNSFNPSHDFSVYDNDGDGAIDYFVVMWTGPIGDWASFWWGYQTSFSDGAYTLDGKTLGKYSWQWEANSPVVVIHETGHALGLPDLYDPPNSTSGPNGGLGGFDMMDANAFDHNAFSKWLLEWLTPTVVPGASEFKTLNPSATHPEALVVWPGVSLGDQFSEFYLVQNRQSVGNDDMGFRPNGLSIWHVDSTLDASGCCFVYSNPSSSHKLIRLMEADGLEEIESGSGVDNNDLYGEGDRFGPFTTPSSTAYSGTTTCVDVSGIDDLGNNAPITAAVSSVCDFPYLRYDSYVGLTEVEGNGNDGIDPGETWELTVKIRNDGEEPAAGITADLSQDPASPISVTMLKATSTYADLGAGGVTASVQRYRFKVNSPAPCGQWISLSLAAKSTDPANLYPIETIRILVGAAASERVFYQSFESGSLPEVQGEWESDSPRGLGSPPDPNVGFEGLRVLGNDLTGKGVVPGNYETSVRSEFEVASLDLSRYDGASVSFARWLNVGAGDSAAFEVWRPEGPTVWQYETVFSSTDADDSSWKLESFDISDFAGGRNPILFKFRIDSDSQETASGWNIDAFEVRGVLPVSCAPYMPTLPGEASNLRVGKGTPGQLTLEWNADCGAATTYGIYRGDLRVGYSSISQEPGKCDVTGTTTTVPLGSGQAQFFLVAPHSNGKEGSYGQGTSGLPRPPAAGACYPQGAVAACVP